MASLFESFSMLTFVGTIISLLVLYFAFLAFYRLTLHPLSSYPGPPLWSMTVLPSAYQILCGTLPYKVASLHEKYGPVIRIGPNELSYIVAEAWNDIYVMGEAPDLIDADVEGHIRMRRNLSHGFSEKALRGQEYIIKGCTNLLMQRLRENSEKGPVDVVKWFNFTTFDIIGDLTFGESFGCLETSNMHFWVKIIFDAVKSIAYLGLTRLFSPLDKILLSLAPKSAKEMQMRHSELTKAKLLKRLELQDPRPDFLSHVQHYINDPSGMTIPELLSTMTLFVIAGAETTASLLSGVTYFLLTRPLALSRLQAEIRNQFKSEEEITIVSVNKLDYMFAVLNEALRLYPPSPESFKRVTPPSGCDITGRFVPGNTSVAVSQWSANHSAANFARVEEFIPERWMGEEEFKNDKRKVVQPFSVGPRNCIGQNLALAEMRLILASLVWNFDMQHTEQSRNWMKGQKIWLTFEKPPMMVDLRPVAKA